jgi:hypothetical protein
MDILKLYITELLNLITDINNRIIPHDHQVKDFKDQINWLINSSKLKSNCRLAFHPWLFQERLNVNHEFGMQAEYIKYPFIGIFNTSGSIFSDSVPINKFEQIQQHFHRQIDNPDDEEEVRFSPPNLMMFRDNKQIGTSFVSCIDVNENKGCLYLILSLPEYFDDNYFDNTKSYNDLCIKINKYKIKENHNYNFLDNKTIKETEIYNTPGLVEHRLYKGLNINDYFENNYYKSRSFDVLDININDIPFYNNNIKEKIPNQCYRISSNYYDKIGTMSPEQLAAAEAALLYEDPEDAPDSEIITHSIGSFDLEPFNKDLIKWEFKIYILYDFS